MKYRTWFRERRMTFQKPLPMKVAMGRCLLGLSEYVTTPLPGLPPPSYGFPQEPMCHLCAVSLLPSRPVSRVRCVCDVRGMGGVLCG